MEVSRKEVKVLTVGHITVVESPLLDKPLLEDEVMVRLDSAPFNPSDFYFAHKMFPKQPSPPFRLGFEGFGVIEKVGSEAHNGLINKQCLYITFSGSYATHLVLKRKEVYVIGDNIDSGRIRQSFAVNPLTAWALVQRAKEKKASAIIHTAASSNVGKWITVIAKHEGIKTIGLVRHENRKAELLELGATAVLNCTDKFYDLELKTVLAENAPTVLFDALGGEKPARILESMPDGSLLVSYGSLEKAGIDGIYYGTLVSRKTVEGFVMLSDMMPFKSHEEIQQMLNSLYSLEGKVFEQVQIVHFNEAGSLIHEWPKRKAKLILKP